MLLPLESLALSALSSSQFLKASQALQEGLQIARQSHDQWSEAWCLYWLSLVAIGRQEYEEARQIARESFRIATSYPDIWLKALVTFVLGRAANALQDYAEATRQLQQGLHLFEDIGQPWGIATGYWYLGSTAYLLQDYEEAGYCYRQSLKIFNLTGQRHFTVCVLFDVARLFIAQSQNAQAQQLLNFVQEHPTSSKELREEALNLLYTLETDLSSNTHKVSNKYPAAKELDAIVSELLDS